MEKQKTKERNAKWCEDYRTRQKAKREAEIKGYQATIAALQARVAELEAGMSYRSTYLP